MLRNTLLNKNHNLLYKLGCDENKNLVTQCTRYTIVFFYKIDINSPN